MTSGVPLFPTGMVKQYTTPKTFMDDLEDLMDEVVARPTNQTTKNDYQKQHAVVR